MDKAPAGRFVAVLLPAAPALVGNSAYYGPMLQGLGDRLIEGGLCIRPVQALHAYQQEAFLERTAHASAGVVFLGMYKSDEFVRQVARAVPGPKVVLDHHYEGLPVSSVREDAAQGMRAVADHLAELGHTSVAYIDNATAGANPWKREGLRAALEAHGLGLPRGWVAGCRVIEYDLSTADIRASDVYAAMEWFVGLEPRPTAVVCSDDDRALLAVRAAEALGLSVPGDLSVTGYGDLAFRTGAGQFLTSLRMDPRAMGRRAAEIILDPASAGSGSVLLPLELVIRRSSGPPPAAA